MNIINTVRDIISYYWYFITQVLLMGVNRRLAYSREQMVIHVINQLTDSDKQYIKNLQEDQLISLHLSLGMQIRNYFWLWDKHNPHTKGFSSGEDPRHPDNVSYEIIVDIWKKLQGA